MLRNLSKYYLLICCKQGSSTHFCHFLATAFVTDVLAGSNPMHWAQKERSLHRWRPNNSVVGDEGCPRAAGAARAPLRRSAPRVLRWKTLARFLSSAPWRVRTPCAGPKKKGPHSWEPIKSVVGDEGCRVRLTPPAFASGLRPSRAALENVSRFLSFAPCRVRIPCAGPKQKRSPCEDRFQFNGGR